MEKPSKRAGDIRLGLFVAGGLVGLVQLHGHFGFGEGYETVAIARNIAAHGAFANPFQAANTGPTAVSPPLYPLFLALLTMALKVPSAVAMAAGIANVIANAAIAALLPRFSQLVYSRAEPGMAAAVLWLAGVGLMPSWDASFTVAGLILFCMFSAASVSSAVAPARAAVPCGIGAGLLLLLNPASAMIFGPWVAFLLVRRKLPARIVFAFSCAIVATSAVVVSPWVFRNYREMGALVFKTNLGMTMYASLNDCAEASLLDDERSGCYLSRFPNTRVSEALLLREMGEAAYDRMRLADAREWIRAHPRRFAQLTLVRFRQFWLPPLGDTPSGWAIWLITALSIPGLILMARRSEPATVFVLLTLLLYPLMYYLVVTDVRYRYPVLWLSALPAGYLLAEPWRKRGRLYERAVPRSRTLSSALDG